MFGCSVVWVVRRGLVVLEHALLVLARQPMLAWRLGERRTEPFDVVFSGVVTVPTLLAEFACAGHEGKAHGPRAEDGRRCRWRAGGRVCIHAVLSPTAVAVHTRRHLRRRISHRYWELRRRWVEREATVGTYHDESGFLFLILSTYVIGGL